MTDAAARLAEIEAAALRTYARFGLPTRPGHYRRGPRAKTWSWLGAELAPDARWALALARPPGSGWRFGALEALGRGDPRPEVDAAARALSDCRLAREGLNGEATTASVEAALRLGLAFAPSQR